MGLPHFTMLHLSILILIEAVFVALREKFSTTPVLMSI